MSRYSTWRPVLASRMRGLTMPVLEEGSESLNWRKAKRSMNHGACAEVASKSGSVAMRDSKDPRGPIVKYSAGSWRAFIAVAKTGSYDSLGYS